MEGQTVSNYDLKGQFTCDEGKRHDRQSKGSLQGIQIQHPWWLGIRKNLKNSM